MNIVWFSWKDRHHPLAGGAETVSGEIMDRLVRDGHNVRLITSKYKNSGSHRATKGMRTYYVGSRYGVYVKAWLFYRRHMPGWGDWTIDEMNTIPFFASRYTPSRRHTLLAYQLAREVWFYQMFFPLSWVGYHLEPIMLRFLGKQYESTVTESNSAKHDMEHHGLKNVNVFQVGMSLSPVAKLDPKANRTTILSLGAVRPMKRTLDAVQAFEYARDVDNSLSMVLAGDISSAYGKKVSTYIRSSRHSDSIAVLGRVSSETKLSLMQEAAVIVVTSVKEGWGLIVTEANSQGTPAVVYDVDGLRDSVKHKETGYVCSKNNPKDMAQCIITLLEDQSTYDVMRTAAWTWSKNFTFEKSYESFLQASNSDSKQ